MPRVATSEELELLRSAGQAAKWRAAFFAPHTIYSARLASVPSTTDQIAEISFNSGVGTLANVKPDMTLLVGTSAGANDLGICRIRKSPIAGTFYIGEQSLIDWQSNCYLTVTDDYDLYAKHVRIDGTTILMDYDIEFGTQHTVFSPVPVLGPVVRVVKLVLGTAAVQVGPEDDHHSWVFGSSISSHNWTSPSGDISFDDNTLENPTVEVTAPGWHLLYDNVTAANSKARQGVRYIYAWDDDNPPLTVFQADGPVEDDKNGGFSLTLTFSNGVSLADIPDRSLMVLFAEDYYNIGDEQEQVSIGAVTGAENIICIGRTIGESLSYDDESKTTSIEIAGYQEMMKRIHGFPAGIRFKITPAAWTDMPGLTVDKGLYHLLEYHTTAITIMDFIRTEDTRYTAQSFSAFSSIWEQMQQFAYKQILAKSRVDHLGRLFFEPDPNYTPVADRDYPVVMTLTDADLTGRVDLPRDFLHEVGQINLSGVVVDGGGNASAFFSLAPGHIPARTGNIDVNDYLLLEDQTQANELAGLIFGARNNPYKPMRLKLRANNRLVTCFPNQAIAYTVAADKNPRGFAITKNWIPRQRKLSYDGTTGVVEVELVVEAESTPVPAVNGDIPGSSEYTFPPLPGLPSLPSIPVILPGGTGPVTDGGPPRVLVHSPTAGLLLCENFDAGENEQEWYTVNGGLTTGEYQTINRIVVCPSGAIYVLRCGGGYTPFAASDIFIYRAPYAGAAFTLVENLTSARIKMSAPGAPVWIGGIGHNPLAPESLVYNLWDGSQLKFFSGTGLTFADTGITPIGAGAPDSSITYGNNRWRVSGNGTSAKLWILDGNAASLLLTKVHPTDLKTLQIRHVGIATTDKFYMCHNADDQTLTLIEGNGATITHNIGGSFVPSETIAEAEAVFCIDPTGQFILTDRATTGKGKSGDYGASLLDITNLPFTGHNWRFGFAGSSSRWVAVGSYIYYTDDFFNTAPMDKRGNILDLVPILDLNNVKVLEF